MSQLYKLYCVDENKVVTIWSNISPIVCPNNDVHEIELDSVRISEKYNDTIEVIEENGGGYFETSHIAMNIPAGTPGDITEHDVTWVMDILLWKTILTPTSDMIGDIITVVGGPETTIGAIGAVVNIGDTVITVNSTVITNMWRGFLVTLDDGVNKDVLGRCTNVDSVNSTITVETGTTYAYSPLTPTPVKISVYILKDIYISDTNVIEIGSKGFKGKSVSSGQIIRVYYTNNSGTAKTFRFRPEYYNLG